ncbi:MAG: class I SAM-dependent methyltransferase [Planctomycetota bacterium]
MAEPHLPRVALRTDEIQRGPWVYARHVADGRGPGGRASAGAEALAGGSLVEVEDASGRFLGHALWNGSSDIRLRWLSRGKRSALREPGRFLEARLRAADRLRRRTLDLPRVSDAYRVAHAEGDDLPGLIVDRLGDVLVCEYHALGFARLHAEVEQALEALYPEATVLHRIPRSARTNEGMEEDAVPIGPDRGAGTEVEVTEHGIAYPVLAGAGHKTGFFCDQRDNRRRVAELAGGRDVLDLFCNLGGFGLHAARAGARRVRLVDLDEVTLERAGAAADRNRLGLEIRHADAFDVLRELGAGGRGPRPDLIVLDPKKLVVGRADLERGLRAYADLNALALAALPPGGLLATFSCSGAVDLGTFLGTVFGAARRVDVGVRLLEVLGAAPDHPQRPDHPRSRYLKGAILTVDG